MLMKGRIAGIATLAAAAVLFAGGRADAQYFNYSTVFVPNPAVGSNGGTLTFTNGQNLGGAFAGATGTDIVLTQILASSTAPDGSPETITVPYTINVSLQPATIGGTPLAPMQTQSFTGTLTGTMSQNSANIINNNLFQSHIYDFTGLGLGIFDVFRNSYVPPGLPGTNIQGSIGAHVNGTLALVPEPSSLGLLFGSGIGGSLFLLRRRRRA